MGMLETLEIDVPGQGGNHPNNVLFSVPNPEVQDLSGRKDGDTER